MKSLTEEFEEAVRLQIDMLLLTEQSRRTHPKGGMLGEVATFFIGVTMGVLAVRFGNIDASKNL